MFCLGNQRMTMLAIAAAALVASGCTGFHEYVHNGFKVGPNYCKPAAPISDEWIDSTNPRLEIGPMNTAGWWISTGWVPGRPRMGVETWPMLCFGGTVTLNSIVVYIGYNMEKVILGRFWGPDVLGVYTRAVQLIGLPVNTINATIGGVLFSSLSRLQDDPIRFRSFFIKGYTLVMAVTVPTTLFCALFADAQPAFWLDSSDSATGRSRFSYMGTGTVPVVGEPVFDFLKQALKRLHCEPAKLPFDFCGGGL